MALRLEQLGLIPRGSWIAMKESGLAPRKAQAMLELPNHPVSSNPYPDRYKYLTVQAFEQEKISEGQLGRFLRCDPLSARDIVNQCRASTVVEDSGEPTQLELPFERSLLSTSKNGGRTVNE